MISPKPSKTSYLKQALKNLSLVVIPAVIIYFAFTVYAGTLSPGAPPAGTMRTLEEIYNVLAGTFDSSATTANYNGSASQLTKCITRHIATNVGWYKTGGTWGYRKKITIDRTKVSNTNQTNFPVLVSITNTDLKDTAQASPGHVGQSDGGDIFFTSSNGTTKLSHEIEKYDNTTGNLIAWVKVPVLSASADTVIYLYYGNASIANQWDTANVWDSNYKMVQHLSDATTSTTTDSTSNANNGTKLAANEPIETSSGQINEAQSFDGTNDYINIGSLNGLDTAQSITLEAWVNFNNIDDPAERYIFGSRPVAGGSDTMSLSGRNDGVRFETANTTRSAMIFGAVSSNTWNHIVGVREVSGTNETLKLYINGVLKATNTYTSLSVIPNYWAIGRLGGTAAYYHSGLIDEVKISSSANSADWITTEYNNQSLPATFYNLGNEENFGC